MLSNEGPQCCICCVQYDDSDHIPLVVCSEFHTICSKCLEVLLERPGDKLVCPFDSLKSDKMPLSEYKRNRGLLDSFQMTRNFLKTSQKLCFRCPAEAEAEATKLCLHCNKLYCNDCISKKHKYHQTSRLEDVRKMLDEKKNMLNIAIEEFEESVSGEERILILIERKENELQKQVHTLFEDYHRVLNKQEETVMNGIKEELACIRSRFAANPQEQSEISKWIEKTKVLMTLHENKRIIDHNSILCHLYKQEELLKTLDMSHLEDEEKKEDNQELNQVLNQLIWQPHADFSKDFKKYIPVKVEHKKNGSLFEEVKNDFSSGELDKISRNGKPIKNLFKDAESEISNSNNLSSDYQSETFIENQDRNNLSPIHSQNQSVQQSSEWITKESKFQQNPIQEEMEQLKKAFRASNLEVEVKRDKDFNGIKLVSLYDKTKSPASGFKGDEALEKFFNTINIKELALSLKEVVSLSLTCIGVTRSGVFHLSKTLDRLSYLEFLQVEFFNSGNLKHEDLKPLMQALGRSQNLSHLSLSCQKWKYMQNFNLPYTIGDLALITNLKNLTLNFSECHSLTNDGIAEAFHSFSNLVSLEELKLCFNGCSRVSDDQDSLKSIYQVYSKMGKLKRIEFEFYRCPDFTERGKEALEGPSKVNPNLFARAYR